MTTHIFSEMTLWLRQFSSKIYFYPLCSYPGTHFWRWSLIYLAVHPELWLSSRLVYSPGDTGCCLERLWGVPTWGEGRRNWHLVGKDQGCCSACCHAQDSSTTKTQQVSNVSGAEAERSQDGGKEHTSVRCSAVSWQHRGAEKGLYHCSKGTFCHSEMGHTASLLFTVIDLKTSTLA